MTPSALLLSQIENIARDAGKAILNIYSGDFTVNSKADDSPLTAADCAAHEIIVAELSKLQPFLPILSEEGSKEIAENTDWGKYWLVDPLDGTREFVNRNGEFTVNIALIEDGRPILGVVYAPVPDVAYVAASNLGTHKVTSGNHRVKIHVSQHDDNLPWRIVGSRSHAGDSLSAFLENLGNHELISMGSSLKFCLVADGSADLYPRLGPTSLWDTAAAQCVVEQAGGKVIQLNGQPLSYENPRKTLNPYFLVHGGSDMDWPGHFTQKNTVV